MKKVFARYHYVLLVVILGFAFITRIYHLNLPERYIFDEVYHAVTAKLIARNDPWAYQWWNPPVEPDTAVDWLHPPLAKYTQALSMEVFGENTFGWRFSSVVFGVLVILAVYKLTLILFKDQNLALLASLLASLDGLLLVQSRIAMNDIHVTFFILVALIALWQYLQYKWAWLTQKNHTVTTKKLFFWSLATGIVSGLALGTKWSGLFIVLFIWVCEAVTWLWAWFKLHKWHPKQLNLVCFNVLVLGFLPFAVYVLSYIHMFTLGHSLFCHQEMQSNTQCYFERIEYKGDVVFEGYISHFAELHRQIWLYQTNLTATHPYQSRPWQWFLNLRPVWYHVEYFDDGRIANIYAFGNPVLFLLADVAVFVTLGYLAYLVFKHKKINWALVFLILAYLSVWLPWMQSPRIMFFYHYTPAVPLVVIILAFWLQQLWRDKTPYHGSQVAAGVAIGLIAAAFIVWYPLWTGIPVPQSWADHVYFAVKAWK